MKAFVKTLFGDTLNIAGVALIVAVAAVRNRNRAC